MRSWKMVMLLAEVTRPKGDATLGRTARYLLATFSVKPLPLFLMLMGMGVSERETAVPSTRRYFFAPRL